MRQCTAPYAHSQTHGTGSEAGGEADAQVHDDALVDLLPQMGAEDLDEGDLERRDFAVHEDARQVQLDLEAHIDIGAVDRGAPPQREAPIGDLVQTRALRIGQLLVPASQGQAVDSMSFRCCPKVILRCQHATCTHGLPSQTAI